MNTRYVSVPCAAVAAFAIGGATLANCGGSVTFGQGASQDPDTYAYVITPGQGVVDDTLIGRWFAVGSGDARVGAGDDSGSRRTSQWLRQSGPGKFYMAGDWIDAGVDGCIANAGFPPMAVAFADRDAGGDGYFALACVGNGHDAFRLTYDFNFIAGGPGRSIELAPLPKLEVEKGEGREVVVSWNRPEAGFYSDASCDARSLVRFGLFYTEAAEAGAVGARSVGSDPTRSWVRVPGTQFVDGTSLRFVAPRPSSATAAMFLAVGVKLDGNPDAFVLPTVGAHKRLDVHAP